MADVLGFMKKILPFVGAAATGNVPALVGLAAQTVGQIVGSKVKADPDSIAAAIAGATPDQLAQLKQAEMDFQAKMQALGFEHSEELEKIAADDRASARARQIALRDKVPPILATVITFGFFGILLMVFRWGVKDASRDLANIMIGTLGTAWVSVVTYYFGSSAGSAAKDDLLNKK